MSTTFVAQNKTLFSIVAMGTFALFIAALGPGLYGEPLLPWISWQHIVFNDLCHQDPSRSFYLSSTPMAVCSRCFGFYASLVGGWFLMPLIVYYAKVQRKLLFRLLIGSILLNLLDVAGNGFGLWVNTNMSRSVLGAMAGLSIVFLLMDDFFQHKTQEV